MGKCWASRLCICAVRSELVVGWCGNIRNDTTGRSRLQSDMAGSNATVRGRLFVSDPSNASVVSKQLLQ
jgi:hypothetical protein